MPDRLPDWAVRLDTGWDMACTPPGAAADPAGLGADLAWWPAPVPGTAAQALQAAGVWACADPAPLHDQDVWYRLHVPALGPGRLQFQGLATVAELWIDGALRLRSQSMFQSHAVSLDLQRPAWVVLCFRSLDGGLAEQAGSRAWPRARWRTRLVADRRLRLLRTTLLGHLPDWCPAVHAVGPWRPVAFVPDRPPGPAVVSHRLHPRWDGVDGWIEARVQVLGALPGAAVALQVGDAAPVPLDWAAEGVAVGTVHVRQPAPWWPHTHGVPALHAVTLHLDAARLPLGRIGFRSIEAGEGLQLRVNGVAVFCRGAAWLTPDLVRLGGTREDVAARLRLVRDAGLNMLRVPGVAHYQDDVFHDLCDELGIMVWQDLMFASMDYPTRDPAFAAAAAAEVEWALGHLSASPSLAVVCGGSEVAQQAAMMGQGEATWRDPFYTDVLPAAVALACPGVPWVPNSPWGEGWPFAPAAGTPAHYFGVGAYCRPLDDAQSSGVRFASECLAFSHVPCGRTLDDGLPGAPLHGPRWKAAVPRDPGAPWDFEDIRDHYTSLLFGADPAATRMHDPARYLMLARATASEILEDVVAGWRWPGSANGALVWHLADFVPGAGWGVVDAYGRPKAAWHGLRRASAPLRLVLRDMGLNGLGACAVNDGPEPRALMLRLRCLRGGLVPVASADLPVQVPAHGATVIPPATLLPRFFDITYAYRFGPPEHDVTVAWLEDARTGEAMAAAHHFPRGRAAVAGAGLQADVVQDADGWWLLAEADRFALCVHVQDPHWHAADDWFHLPPGQPRRIRLHPYDPAPPGPPQGRLCAVNAAQPAVYRGAA